jgi:hypothetical protein
MSIAQEIRNAAPFWPGPVPMSDQARHVCAIFEDGPEVPWDGEPHVHYATFLLFVAEELSPSLPVDDLPALTKLLNRYATASVLAERKRCLAAIQSVAFDGCHQWVSETVEKCAAAIRAQGG